MASHPWIVAFSFGLSALWLIERLSQFP